MKPPNRLKALGGLPAGRGIRCRRLQHKSAEESGKLWGNCGKVVLRSKTSKWFRLGKQLILRQTRHEAKAFGPNPSTHPREPPGEITGNQMNPMHGTASTMPGSQAGHNAPWGSGTEGARQRWRETEGYDTGRGGPENTGGGVHENSSRPLSYNH